MSTETENMLSIIAMVVALIIILFGVKWWIDSGHYKNSNGQTFQQFNAMRIDCVNKYANFKLNDIPAKCREFF